jgi:hypothetical protein
MGLCDRIYLVILPIENCAYSHTNHKYRYRELRSPCQHTQVGGNSGTGKYKSVLIGIIVRTPPSININNRLCVDSVGVSVMQRFFPVVYSHMRYENTTTHS